MNLGIWGKRILKGIKKSGSIKICMEKETRKIKIQGNWKDKDI